MSDCEHACESLAAFPKSIYNRPALDSIAYRIGTYSSLRTAMLSALNQNQTLERWTHRGSDDPGIALLESHAIVGDILTFYQNLYANEAYVRTATWRESIAQLIQLGGYRYAPGVGGEGVFTLKIKGSDAVTVPAGFGFKAQLENQEAEQEFESTSSITAYPDISEFRLYRKAEAPQNIARDMRQLEIKAVDGNQDSGSKQALDIAAGDKILLVPNSDMFDINGENYIAQEKPEIAIVEAVEQILDRVVLTFEGKLTISRDTEIRAFKINRSFRHFGHNAQRKFTQINADTNQVSFASTNFSRYIAGTSAGSEYYSGFLDTQMPLDSEVDDLALGAKLICQGVSAFRDSTKSGSPQLSEQHFMVVKTIEALQSDNVIWANVEASTTVVTLDNQLVTNYSLLSEDTDIRRTLFHEAIGPELLLEAPRTFTDGDFSDGQLQYYGTYTQVQALAERELLLFDENTEQVQQLKTTTTLAEFSQQLVQRDAQNSWLWDIVLDHVPQYSRQSFDHADPHIFVYGNLVHTNQGKTEAETVLGSGDNRKKWQTFPLPKASLTYLLDESATPAQVPQLTVYVEGLAWQRVNTFFNRNADEKIYIVREDEEGLSYIQFGDGVHGARLPSGRNNISVTFRTGIAASGRLEKDKKPSATGKLTRLEKVYLPGEVVGGDIAESEENARQVAPERLQSLGRMVGLADFETEARAIPGVKKVQAQWAAPSGVPLIQMMVLTDAGTSASVNKVQSTLNGFNRCRGPKRFPISVRQGVLQYIFLSLRVGFDAARKQEDVAENIMLALGIVDETEAKGLFSLSHRTFGQNAHRSQILAAVQGAEGVRWVDIDDAQALALGDPINTDPLTLPLPEIPSNAKVVPCEDSCVLALHRQHLHINFVMQDNSEECSS